MPSNTIRIARNTLMLYFRQLLIMLVSLYTVRVVLNTLGAEDYGIYNVVAGVVVMFGFLSGAMATASQRYFAFELGRGDLERLKKIFSVSLVIYGMIAVLVLALAETAGLWFVANKLTIPVKRGNAALWVYQFSVISFMFTIMVTPFMAAIMAHEDMNIYAAVSIVEILLKLGIVFLLKIIALDKLQIYGTLLCAVTIINMVIHIVICKIKYQECIFKFSWNKNLFKEIAVFTGWNLFGTCAWMVRNPMINILLNQFFTPVIVAARGIASQVNAAVSSFSNNFSSALRPQIVKSYAAEQKAEMLVLMFRGAKVTYFLMFIFTLPLVLEMPEVLCLWLKNPPEYAMLFTRLALIEALMDSTSYPIGAAIQATGRIRLYQSLVGGIFLLNLPLSWIALLTGFPAYSVMIVAICLTFVALLVRQLIARYIINYSILQFFREVILPIIMVSSLSMILPLFLHCMLEQNLLRLFFVTCASVISTCLVIYFIGLTAPERKKVKSIVQNIGPLSKLTGLLNKPNVNLWGFTVKRNNLNKIKICGLLCLGIAAGILFLNRSIIISHLVITAGKWPKGFDVVEIYSSYDSQVQRAYFYASRQNKKMPLIVSLHTWAGDYRQQDPLAELVKTEDWNYIHPDFRGQNNSPDACMSETVIQDIDDAVAYAVKNGNVDTDNIVVVGMSGGGMAVLGVFLKSSYSFKYCMAWSPISDLESWYYQSKFKGDGYWKDILSVTSSNGDLSIEEARRRSPLYVALPEGKSRGLLELYAGLNDGYTGSVSILHSLLFYNKMAEYFGISGDIISDKEILMLVSRTVEPEEDTEYLDTRKIFYTKTSKNISLFVFDGAHEMLPDYAFARIKAICSME